jgi:hypothetical protein
MKRLRENVTDDRTRYTLWLSGELWNELVQHREAVSVGPVESMSRMLERWIESRLRREQQELDE